MDLRKEYLKQWYLNNKERCKAISKKYYAKHKKQHHEWVRLWRIKNPTYGKLMMREKRKLLIKKFKCKICGKEYLAKQDKLLVCSKKCRSQDSEFMEKIKISLNLKPNNFEKSFLLWLKKNIKGAWEYTGDFSFWVKNKNPDIVDKKQKIAIELFGDYWHKLHIKEKRVSEKGYILQYQNHYKKNGWKLIIIWLSEFKTGAFIKKFKI